MCSGLGWSAAATSFATAARTSSPAGISSVFESGVLDCCADNVAATVRAAIANSFSQRVFGFGQAIKRLEYQCQLEDASKMGRQRMANVLVKTHLACRPLS